MKELFAGHLGDVLAVDLDGSIGRFDQPDQRTYQGGFTTSRKPHEDVELASFDLKTDVPHADDTAGLLLDLIFAEILHLLGKDLFGIFSVYLPQILYDDLWLFFLFTHIVFL